MNIRGDSIKGSVVSSHDNAFSVEMQRRLLYSNSSIVIQGLPELTTHRKTLCAGVIECKKKNANEKVLSGACNTNVTSPTSVKIFLHL